MKLLVLALALASCRTPSYFELHGGAAEAQMDFDRSFAQADTDTYYLGATLGWSLGDRYASERNLALLRPTLDLGGHADHSAPITLNVPQAAPQEPSGEADPSDDDLLDPIRKPAQTTEEAIMLLIWLGTIGIALFGAKKLGLLDRVLGKGR